MTANDKNWRQHLKNPKKGEVRNPKGRPKGKSLTTILRDILEKKTNIKDPFTQKLSQQQIKKIINLKIVAQAINGNLKACEMIYDRMEGRVNLIAGEEPKQAINIFNVQNEKAKQTVEALNNTIDDL